MKQALVPTYYEQFQCIGSACEDTCCTGWQVTIDERTFKKYRKLRPSPIQKNIKRVMKRNRSNPSFSHYGSIRLGEKGCPLLTESGLCGVQAELGSEYLSRTCATYPRETNYIQEQWEASMTLSCPETARLALLNKDGIAFEEIEIPKTAWDDRVKKQNHSTLWPLRIATIRLLQNRTTTIENRLIILGLFLQKVNDTENITVEAIEQLAITYENRLLNEEFLQQLSTLPKQLQFQLKMMTELLKETRVIKHPRFIQCVQQSVESLQLSNDLPNIEKVQVFEIAAHEQYEQFVNEHKYMLENYLVNHVFKELFPLDEPTLFESCRKMIMYFILIKFHLIGVAKYKDGLTPDDAVVVIQSFSRVIEHNQRYVKRALQLLEEENITTIGGLVTLIRH